MLGFVKQFLEHGKLITKANFPTFVETWNWLVEGFGNLRGDADVNGATGHIKVDLTDPKHPVVRLVNANFGGDIDDSNFIKKNETAANNMFPKGYGIGFDGFTVYANSSNSALCIDHTTGQVFSIPNTIDSIISLKRRKLKIADNGTPETGTTLLDYGSITIQGIQTMPFVSFRYGTTNEQVASLQPNATTKALYINDTNGIVLNGKADEVKLLQTPTAILENSSNNLNLPNLKWIYNQLKDFIVNGASSGVKILSTKSIEITEKQLAEGDGIKLTTSADGKTITISATAQSGGGVGTIDYVCDVKYDMSDYCLKKLMAHTNFATGKTTFGSNYSTTKSGGTWELFAEGAQTVPMT